MIGYALWLAKHSLNLFSVIFSSKMIGIGNIVPKPKVKLDEECFRMIIYGFTCKLYNEGKWKSVSIFQDPGCYLMMNIFDLQTNTLIKIINYFDLLIVIWN